MTLGPTVASVNVGVPRTVRWRGRSITTAIWKTPVPGSVPVRGVNLAGDDQADRRVHGGADKAVYAYASEDYQWWTTQGVEVETASFGENVTTRGLDLRECHVGDRWYLGTTVLEVAQPRTPCFKLGIRVGNDAFPERFASAKRPGVYLRIVTEGAIAAGDTIAVHFADDPSVSVLDLIDDDASQALLAAVASDVRVPEPWRRHAARKSLQQERPGA